MASSISSAERATYYLVALRLLRVAEARSPTGRRFGPDADALWKDFAGGLNTSDRIDLLLRDADTEWPGAFGARAIFALRAVAEDDAFGAQWSSLEPIDAERIWKDAMRTEVPTTVDAAIDQLATAWELRLSRCDVPRVGPTSRLFVGGATAIRAVIGTFASNADLSWTPQVVVIADRPAERQLAATAVMLLNSTRPTTLLASDDPPGAITSPPVAVLSDDATAEVRAAIQRLS